MLRIAGSPVTFHSKVLAAVLAAGEGAAASHRTAAVLWGLDGFRAGVIEVAHPRGRWHRPTGVIVHQSSDLDRCTIRSVDGIPVTDPSRTILDLARRTSDARLFAAMESARRKKISSWEQLVSTLLRHARQGRPGIERTRRVITVHIDEGEVTDSMFEAMVLALFAEHGLPVPVLHHRIVRSDGSFVAEVDLAYPSRLIAIELDGEVHREREVFHRDRPRQNELELLGWLVLRFTWRQLVEQPELIVRQVREALARRPSVISG
ncbi:MAG: DUF559 domain-containing protein [Actinomycetota bacterium]|nr:DUF559 domain-containing protein [Actinomycetota bacterium]